MTKLCNRYCATFPACACFGKPDTVMTPKGPWLRANLSPEGIAALEPADEDTADLLWQLRASMLSAENSPPANVLDAMSSIARQVGRFMGAAASIDRGLASAEAMNLAACAVHTVKAMRSPLPIYSSGPPTPDRPVDLAEMVPEGSAYQAQYHWIKRGRGGATTVAEWIMGAWQVCGCEEPMAPGHMHREGWRWLCAVATP